MNNLPVGNGKFVKAPRALLFAILLAALALTAIFLPVEPLMSAIQDWVISHPSSAVFVVTACIVLGILLLLPLSLMFMLKVSTFISRAACAIILVKRNVN